MTHPEGWEKRLSGRPQPRIEWSPERAERRPSMTRYVVDPEGETAQSEDGDIIALCEYGVLWASPGSEVWVA